MKANDPRFDIAAWIGIALLAAAAIFTAWRGEWLATLGITGFLIASAAFVVFDSRLPTLFNFLFVIAAIVNAAGWVWRFYETIAGYDEAVHFYTTFAVTLSAGYLTYYAVREYFRHHRAHFVLVISSFGLSLGALWEIFEWVILPSLNNPVEDLIMDGLGAVLAGLVAAWALGVDSVETAEAGDEANESKSSGPRQQ
jgi:hypothetical protein